MCQCPKKLVTKKEYGCFDHSDFPAHLLFTFDVCWGSLGLVSSETQVQQQIILDPDHLPDYPSVSYDYDLLCLSFVDKNLYVKPMCKHQGVS